MWLVSLGKGTKHGGLAHCFLLSSELVDHWECMLSLLFATMQGFRWHVLGESRGCPDFSVIGWVS